MWAMHFRNTTGNMADSKDVLAALKTHLDQISEDVEAMKAALTLLQCAQDEADEDQDEGEEDQDEGEEDQDEAEEDQDEGEEDQDEADEDQDEGEEDQDEADEDHQQQKLGKRKGFSREVTTRRNELLYDISLVHSTQGKKYRKYDWDRIESEFTSRCDLEFQALNRDELKTILQSAKNKNKRRRVDGGES